MKDTYEDKNEMLLEEVTDFDNQETRKERCAEPMRRFARKIFALSAMIILFSLSSLYQFYLHNFVDALVELVLLCGLGTVGMFAATANALTLRVFLTQAFLIGLITGGLLELTIVVLRYATANLRAICSLGLSRAQCEQELSAELWAFLVEMILLFFGGAISIGMTVYYLVLVKRARDPWNTFAVTTRPPSLEFKPVSTVIPKEEEEERENDEGMESVEF